MLQKGSEQYKQAQKLANEIKDMAGTDRWNNNSYFDIAFNALGQFISKVQATDGFAAKIAETVDKTMNPYGNQNSFYVMTDEERQDRFQEVNEDDLFPWIKVEDAKPKEEQVVIVLYRKYGDLQVARHCFYKDSSLVNGKWIHANSIVIAWLPEPKSENV